MLAFKLFPSSSPEFHRIATPTCSQRRSRRSSVRRRTSRSTRFRPWLSPKQNIKADCLLVSLLLFPEGAQSNRISNLRDFVQTLGHLRWPVRTSVLKRPSATGNSIYLLVATSTDINPLF
ncbi:hypothetical protein BDZ89DRAFT_488151 [Hymenopellis radicata]|nr:hypothetical protein BDZ89DRAFT_488151 [Hymenopellis radicata]